MKPFRNLIFILAVFALLLLISVVFPKEGIPVGSEYRLKFINTAALFTRDSSINTYADSLISVNTATDDPEDSSQADSMFVVNDSLLMVKRDSLIRVRLDSISRNVWRIECPGPGRILLDSFFLRAAAATNQAKPVRILHYGDSQIENDRMTSLIRFRLQKVFGGTGCGIVPAVPLYSGNPVFREEQTGTWTRYTGFGRRDTTLDHRSYGAMGCFTAIPLPEPEIPTLSFEFIPGRRASRFDKVTIFMHAYSDSGMVVAHFNDTLADTLKYIPGGYRMIQFDVPEEAQKVALSFCLAQGGRLYGLSFDARSGLQVDNMAMRGSSGLEFTTSDRELLETMYADLDPGLIIMQFGGNVVPYIENTAYYGKVFARELKYLRELCPHTAIIVIGPSDMSRKERGRFVTYETLEPVRDALRKAALESGCAFWDMYEAMGGANSMPDFVLADPPLATADYVHFTPRGANMMAGMFVKALLLEYSEYMAK